MRITVESIVSERGFGIIFAGRAVEGDRLRVRATFDRLLGMPAVGDTWEIAGERVSTPYGPQIVATSGRRLLPSGRMIVSFVAKSVPGIGPARAERLWETFGPNLAEVLADEGAVDDIAAALAPDRPVLARRLAVMAIAAWRAAAGEAGLVAWLAQQGVDDLRVARRLHRVLGDDAAERLAANPYAMVPLLPWRSLDKLGQRLLREDGFDPTADARRITGAADEAVKRMLWRGDTAADVTTFVAEMRKLLGPGPDAANCLRIALANGAVVPAGDTVRAPGAAALEDELIARLGSLAGVDARWSALSPSGWSELISQVEDGCRPLSADQRAAVATILSRPFACLSGGAGTGKTTTCKAVCDLWTRASGDVVLCALAGKAALKLSRSTGRLARTLARTLAELAERDELETEFDSLDPDDPTGAKQRARLEALCRLTPRTLLVVDESSMVDPATLLAIVRRLPEGGRILMVGDEAQLPPVKFGLAYHRFVADPAVAVTLRQVHRQAAETGIPAAAQAVREGRMPALPDYAGKADGISMLTVGGAGLAEAVDRICLDFGDDGLVVTSTLGGMAGVRAINERRHAAAAGASAVTKGFYGLAFAVGEPVIYGKNDYALGLFNGLLGRVVAVAADERAVNVHFDGDPEPKRLAGEQLLDLDHAYAVTAHKCQGSSAPRVIVPVFASRLLDRSWVYTAITRAERQVVLVGDPDVLADAVARPPSAELRRSGLRWP
ncbi:AAA family ATPase [Bradyrhizobium liaoningense]|uniref:AAA family ATPase n=1 Tax=Bradyrhizobium liaoningense TaxID=43992 RepID=UPI001BAAD0C0|nr:AAA family ATPase [Bradyrhizobium liaoningense]MBR0841745.1 AAA family ATPase [Bradyrhizobium liaoningense]